MDIPPLKSKTASFDVKLAGLIWGVPKRAVKNGPNSLDVIQAAFAQLVRDLTKKYSSLSGDKTDYEAEIAIKVNGTVYRLEVELAFTGTTPMIEVSDLLDVFLVALKRQLLVDLRNSLEPATSTAALEQAYAFAAVDSDTESALLVSV